MSWETGVDVRRNDGLHCWDAARSDAPVRSQGRETAALDAQAGRDDRQPGAHRGLTGRVSARRLLCVCILVAAPLTARIARADQLEPPGRMLEVVGGLGYTFAQEKDHADGMGTGGFLEAEYVFRPSHVFSPRLYAGALVTFPDDKSCGGDPCDVESKIVFAGAKARIMAPIPYVGPFFELGLGVSAGYLRTLARLDVDERTSGVAIHIPFAIGLALGRRHQYDLEFSYLFHVAERQTGGAVAFGLGFPVY